MRAAAWAALLVGIVAAGAALAAVPASTYRLWILVGGVALIVVALALMIVNTVREQPGPEPEPRPGPVFTVETPQPNQVLNGEGWIIVEGTVPDLDSDSLWVFEEGWIHGRRAWFFGGEAIVAGNRWSYEYRPTDRPVEGARRTLTIVRADRNCDRQLRVVRPDDDGQFIVYDPVPGGCEILGQVSIFLTPRP